MPKKFDTNPLDPEFPEKAKAQTAPVGEYTSPSHRYKTAEIPASPGSVTEEDTRRFDEAQFKAYSFQGGQVPILNRTPEFPSKVDSSNRTVAKAGLPEKWLIGLPYIPFSIGLVASLILLLILPKEETKVRFHAAQGGAAHVGILIVTTILSVVGNVTDFADFGRVVFTAVTTILLLIFAFKAWSGKPVHIAPVEDLTNWLEDKIGPIKS